ncbi:MAG: nitrogenase component 1 [Tannerella sp.]|jgi:nitrogenase molybdenum-iron protein alpha chain|nr:nitrogenase component 1 [Tannerella sp.]
MSILKSRIAPIREKRLQTLVAYSGLPDVLPVELADGQLAQRVRTFSQDTFSDILYALNVITTIKNAAIVIHGASGCAVSRLTFCTKDKSHGKWAITNLNERDSIMGSDTKLRSAIKQIHKLYSPEIIFVLSTPIVAINNDDIESVVVELKDELNVAIVPVYTDGFRSKSGVTGYDIVFYAIVKQLLPPKKVDKISGLVNLFSVSENEEEINAVSELLQQIGLTVNLFPQYASLENIKRLSLAEWSLSINPDESAYAGVLLENRFHIPFLNVDIPAGGINTEVWISRIAEFTGRKEQANRWLQSEKEKRNNSPEEWSFPQQSVFVNLPPSLAFAVSELLEELGHEVTGLKIPYLEAAHIVRIEKIKQHKSNFSFLVGDGQIFEEENVLRKLQPGLYIGKGGDYAAAIRNGIPVIDIENLSVVGFNGVRNLAKKIRQTLSNRSFVELLAGMEAQTYADGWLKKNPNWYIKQEVK